MNDVPDNQLYIAHFCTSCLGVFKYLLINHVFVIKVPYTQIFWKH